MHFHFLLVFCFLPIFCRCDIIPSCPSGAIVSPHDSQWCYKFVNQSASFDDAEYFCENAGGFLAEVNDQFTNNFLYHNAKTNFMSGAFWIGGQMYNTPKDSLWVWVRQSERVLLSFFDWADPEAGTSGTGDCLSVSTENGRWTPQNCSVKLPYVCQMSPTYSISECESGWTHFDQTGKCYKVFAQENVTEMIAEQFCVDHGGHLASIHSSEENDLIGQLTSTLYVGTWPQVAVLIGFVADANFKWSWTDKSTVDYLNWGDMDPDAAYCAYFYPDGVKGNFANYVKKWDAGPCPGQLSRYICKKDPTVTLVKD